MTSDLAIKTLKKGLLTQKIKQSMRKARCPYNNAPMKHFFNTMKMKLIYRHRFSTDEELNSAISEYAYVWYNQNRPHSYNIYLTQYEARKNGL